MFQIGDKVRCSDDLLERHPVLVAEYLGRTGVVTGIRHIDSGFSLFDMYEANIADNNGIYFPDELTKVDD